MVQDPTVNQHKHMGVGRGAGRGLGPPWIWNY